MDRIVKDYLNGNMTDEQMMDIITDLRKSQPDQSEYLEVNGNSCFDPYSYFQFGVNAENYTDFIQNALDNISIEIYDTVGAISAKVIKKFIDDHRIDMILTLAQMNLSKILQSFFDELDKEIKNDTV